MSSSTKHKLNSKRKIYSDKMRLKVFCDAGQTLCKPGNLIQFIKQLEIRKRLKLEMACNIYPPDFGQALYRVIQWLVIHGLRRVNHPN